MNHNDVDLLRRRIEILIRSANTIAAHARDLHDLGWEPHHGETEKVAGGETDHAPRGGDPRARRLYERIFNDIGSIESELVGHQRTMKALFVARAERPEPTRGSTISVAEFDTKLAKQKQNRANGHYVPARLEPQPQHPGKRR